MSIRKYSKLFKSKQGIRLDIGAGNNRQKGFVTMDIRPLPNIDIVWDLQKIPYPLPDNCCLQILGSHIWEHLEPKYRIDIMNELWRIMKLDGQLILSMPYAGSFGSLQDPTHYNSANEATFTYYSPDYPLYKVYSPKPWRLIRNDYSMTGNMEIVMEAIKK
jgi:predicted SAM-dependent methyltransferase